MKCIFLHWCITSIYNLDLSFFFISQKQFPFLAKYRKLASRTHSWIYPALITRPFSLSKIQDFEQRLLIEPRVVFASLGYHQMALLDITEKEMFVFLINYFFLEKTEHILLSEHVVVIFRLQNCSPYVLISTCIFVVNIG